jgi:hypothetical protein
MLPRSVVRAGLLPSVTVSDARQAVRQLDVFSYSYLLLPYVSTPPSHVPPHCRCRQSRFTHRCLTPAVRVPPRRLPPPWIRTACELPTQPSSAWELSRGTVVSGTSLCHRNLDDHPLRTPSAGGGARQLLLACWGLREARGLRVILAPVQRIPNAKCKEDADGDTDSDAGASSTRVITRAITVNPHLHRESLGIWYRRWLSW